MLDPAVLDPKNFFFGGGGCRGDGGQTRQQICSRKAFDSCRPPAPTLTSEPGYAIAGIVHNKSADSLGVGVRR